MEDLSFDNIFTGQEMDDLFSEDTQDTSPDEDVEDSQEESEENDDLKKETTEINPEELFEESESVSSGENIEEKEDTTSEKGTSPKFYSSIAKAFADDGIFPDLNEEDISNVKNSDDFRNLVENQINQQLDSKYKRINEALGYGVQPDLIKVFETTIEYLNTIDEASIEAEDEAGEDLRKKLIYQDYINRGYSKQKAQKEVEKSINGGTDIDDAKDALEGNLNYFKSNYKKIVDEAKKEAEQQKKYQAEQAESLRKSILEDKNFFGEIEVDKPTRQKILDNIVKPVYRDDKTGQLYTELQKYEMDNRVEFIKNLSLVYTLTNGFKDFNGLIKNKVKKEVKKGFDELESVLNNTQRTSDGNLNFMGGGNDKESFIGKGWKLDI